MVNKQTRIEILKQSEPIYILSQNFERKHKDYTLVQTQSTLNAKKKKCEYIYIFI